MTIASEDARTGPYTGNGATTVFAYDFKVSDESHLVVTLKVTATGVETVQTLTTHYSVSGVGTEGGGNVTMVTSPASTETLTISRSVPRTQGTDLQNRGATQPATLEAAYDKGVQISQDLAEVQARTMKFAVSSDLTSFDTDIPSPVASKAIAINAAGTAFELVDEPSAAQAAAAVSAAAALVSENAAAADAVSTAADVVSTNADVVAAAASAVAAASYVTPTSEQFADGVGFTAGTTTTLLLAASLADEDFLQVTFDGVTQHHDTFSIAGSPSTITFDAAIPVGVTDVEAIYGVRSASQLSSNMAWDANVNMNTYDLTTTGNLSATDLVLSGDLTVNGTTTTLDVTNVAVSDNLMELNAGATSNANDSGLLIERGSTGDNAILAWDESADGFIVGTTTATGSATGNLTIAAAPFTAAALTATTGTFSGEVTATGFTGTLDGILGGGTPAAATVTSLNATGGGSLTGTWSDLGTVTTVDINGGTIDGTVIGGASTAAVTGTLITATTNFAGDLTGNVTGNASGTAATVTGATQAAITTAANLVTVGALNSGSITSGFGNIDIGSSTLSAGATDVTTLTASGQLKMSGTRLISTNVSNGFLELSGDSATGTGANILLFGGSHATTGDIIFQNGATEAYRYDASDPQHEFTGAVSMSSTLSAGATTFWDGSGGAITPGGEGYVHIKKDDAGEVELLTVENSTGTGGKATITLKTTSTDATKSAQIVAERVNASGHTSLALRTFNGTTSDALVLDEDGAATFAGNIVVQGTNPTFNAGAAISTTDFEYNGSRRISISAQSAEGLVVVRDSGEVATIHLFGATGNATFAGDVAMQDLRLGVGVGSMLIEPDAATKDLVIKTTNGGSAVLTLSGANATFAGTADITNGVYIGGSAAANLLDDYEEGSHTATVSCATSGTVTLNSSFDTLAYTKIGRHIHVQGELVVSSVSSPTGYLTVSLPVASLSPGERQGRSVASIAVGDVSGSNIESFVGFLVEGESSLRIYLGDNPSYQADSAQAIVASSFINISLSYLAA